MAKLTLTPFRDAAGSECDFSLRDVPATVVRDELLRLGFDGILGMLFIEQFREVTIRRGQLLALTVD